MYAISEFAQKINGTEIRTFARDIVHQRTQLSAEAGTTGFRGYVKREDSARAYLSIDCSEGDFLFEPIVDDEGTVTGITIASCGDGALMGLIDALEFALEAFVDECE